MAGLPYFFPSSFYLLLFYNKNHEKIETNLLAVSNPDLEKYFPEDMRLIYNPADLASNQNYLSNLKDYSSAGKRVDNFLKQNKPTYENLYGTRFGTTQGNQILQQASQIYSGFEIHRDPQKITQEIQTYTQSLRNQGILNPNEDLPSFDISNSLGYNQFNSDLNILESVGNIFVACLLDVHNDGCAGQLVRRAAAGRGILRHLFQRFCREGHECPGAHPQREGFL